MAKTPLNIKSLARVHTESALNVLAGIMNEPTAPHAARVAAAIALLDRGWGKPTQTLVGAEGGSVQFERIERVIVHATVDHNLVDEQPVDDWPQLPAPDDVVN